MTIAHIAAQAGVSVPTVSKVINGRSDVALKTRQRVEAVIREQGYERSNRSAGSSALLEVIFNELESDWALEIIKGVERVARENDLAVVLSDVQGRRTPGKRWIDGVLARRPVGVIAVLSDLSDGAAIACSSPGTSRSWPWTRRASRSTTRRRSGRRTGAAAWRRPATCWPSATAGSR